MAHYQPILKAKPGEFAAWQNASTAVRSTSDPIFELAYNPKSDYANYLRSTIDKLVLSHAPGSVITLDGGHLDQAAATAPGRKRLIPWLRDELAANKLHLRPVARPQDSPTVTADIRAAASHGVAVRIGAAGAPPTRSYVSAELPKIMKALGISGESTHLTLDYQEILTSNAVALSILAADDTLKWLASQPALASTHVASAGFPASISDLPLSKVNLLERHDAAFYSGLAIPVELSVGFSDYAVNGAGPVSPDARAPLPNLRYTTGGQWLVWREAKQQPGNSAFYAVCRNVAKSAYFDGASYSWGDEYIADRNIPTPKPGDGAAPGAGTAKEWRSAGTSHHLEKVVNRLSTLGVP